MFSVAPTMVLIMVTMFVKLFEQAVLFANRKKKCTERWQDALPYAAESQGRYISTPAQGPKNKL